jgi:hypothetical protein
MFRIFSLNFISKNDYAFIILYRRRSCLADFFLIADNHMSLLCFKKEKNIPTNRTISIHPAILPRPNHLSPTTIHRNNQIHLQPKLRKPFATDKALLHKKALSVSK